MCLFRPRAKLPTFILTVNIIFRVAYDFGILWKEHGFPPFIGNKLEIACMSGVLLVTLGIIKIPGHSKLDSLEGKENYLADISTRNVSLKGTSHVPKGYFPS